MLIGARTCIAHWAYVLIAALLSASIALLVISVVATENTASAQSTPSSGSAPTCEGGSLSLNDYEMRTYELHNQTRASNNLTTLCVSEILTQAARSHSQEMLDQGYFSHNSYNGESSSARLERFDYNSYKKVGENIAWGSGGLASPENIFQGWMESSGHRKNILDPDYREVGIGTATGECEGYSDCTMYTADFGVRQSSAPPEANTPQEADNAEGGTATRGALSQYILRRIQSLGF